MSDLTAAVEAAADPAYLVVLLHTYGQAHARQYARPTDEGNQALGDAARAIYAYTDAREAAARADERAKVAEAERLKTDDGVYVSDFTRGVQHAAAIARGHAVGPAESVAAGIEAPPEGERTSEGSARRTGGLVLPPQPYLYDPAVDGPLIQLRPDPWLAQQQPDESWWSTFPGAMTIIGIIWTIFALLIASALIFGTYGGSAQ